MDLLELLRSQAKRYRCPVCGKSMADCGITILAQQGNRALVRVTCTSCNDENLLQIVFQTEGEAAAKAARRPAGVDEGVPEAPEPISADELLDLHLMLDGHEGGFRELLRRA